MSTAVSRDIAPDFKDMLSKLPLDIVNAMEASFVAGTTDKEITKVDKSILQDFHEEQLKRKRKTIFLPEVKKCLRCNTYHDQDKQYCPVCGRYLYACGSIYQPQVKKNITPQNL